jgi:serine/threonine-protein kinase 24/25/MST4
VVIANTEWLGLRINMHKRTQTNPAERFIPLERLGEGSFGEVFKAYVYCHSTSYNNSRKRSFHPFTWCFCRKDTQTNEIVAIKVIDLEESEDDIAAIRDEITMLSACDSPQIVRYEQVNVQSTGQVCSLCGLS